MEKSSNIYHQIKVTAMGVLLGLTSTRGGFAHSLPRKVSFPGLVDLVP